MEIKLQNTTTTKLSYRTAGWAAIGSGTIGLMAYGFLFTAVTSRTDWVISNYVYLMFMAHDIGVIIQFLLLIPVVFGLFKLSQAKPQGMNRTTLNVGIGALLFTAVFLLLGIVKILGDGHYTIPQGVFGVWLMVANWRLSGVLGKGLRWFGIVVGLGLLIVSLFIPGYAIFVDPVILRIPPVDLTNYPEPPMDLANTILHQMIWIGTIMGVATLPIWTILLGAKFLRERGAVAQLG